jgi:CheY-like chemotaxis protein
METIAMAHVVIAEDDPVSRHLYVTCFEREGHQVTAPDDFWGVLATLRSVAHPVIVIYNRDVWWARVLARQEGLAELEANLEALQRHRYIAMSWKFGALTPRLAAIEVGLHVEVLLQPTPLKDLLAAVERAASKLPGA